MYEKTHRKDSSQKCKFKNKRSKFYNARKHLSHFIPLVSFYTPWKHQRTSGLLMFSGCIEKNQRHEMGSSKQKNCLPYHKKHLEEGSMPQLGSSMMMILLSPIILIKKLHFLLVPPAHCLTRLSKWSVIFKTSP